MKIYNISRWKLIYWLIFKPTEYIKYSNRNVKAILVSLREQECNYIEKIKYLFYEKDENQAIVTNMERVDLLKMVLYEEANPIYDYIKGSEDKSISLKEYNKSINKVCETITIPFTYPDFQLKYIKEKAAYQLAKYIINAGLLKYDSHCYPSIGSDILTFYINII